MKFESQPLGLAGGLDLFESDSELNTTSSVRMVNLTQDVVLDRCDRSVEISTPPVDNRASKYHEIPHSSKVYPQS